jgi:hypothetical protein
LTIFDEATFFVWKETAEAELGLKKNKIKSTLWGYDSNNHRLGIGVRSEKYIPLNCGGASQRVSFVFGSEGRGRGQLLEMQVPEGFCDEAKVKIDILLL